MGSLQYETLSTDPRNVIHAFYLRTPQGALEAVSLNYTIGSSSNTFYYYHYNKHGDIIAITDSNGNLYRQYVFDPYGNIISVKDGSGNTINMKNDSGFNNTYLYGGYRCDQESGLYFLNARYYSSGIGRFLTKDSIVDNTTPQTLNLYTYVCGDPVNAYDPTGCVMEVDEESSYPAPKSNISDTTKSAIESETDKGVGDVAMDSAKTTPYEIYRTMKGNHSTRRAYIRGIPKYERYVEFVPYSFKGVMARLCSFGVLGAISLDMTLNDDFNNYDSHQAWGAVGIDCAWFVLGAIMLAAIPATLPILAVVGCTMLVGAITCVGADLVKNAVLTKRK